MQSPSKNSVSIITRTKDRPMLLRRAIQSVLAQSHTNWTHIIVNDGGNKQAVESLLKEFKKQYAGRLLIIHNTRSRGREAASNAGLKKCKSIYVVFLDDDDTWHSEFVERCLAALKESPLPHPRGVICHSIGIEEEITKNGKIIEIKRWSFNDRMKAVDIPRLCTNNIIPNMSFIFERSLIDEIGGFDENFEVLGDWDFNLRAVLAGEIAVLPEPLAFFHQRPKTKGCYGNSGYTENIFKICRAQMINKWARFEYAKGNFSIAQAMTLAELNGESYRFSYRANKLLGLFMNEQKK